MKRFCSLQHSNALHCHIVNLISRQASIIFWRRVYQKDNMRMIDHPVYFSSLSLNPKSESLSSFINMRKSNPKPETLVAGISRQNEFEAYSRNLPSDNICSSSKSDWSQACERLKFQRICQDIVNSSVRSPRLRSLGASKQNSQNSVNSSMSVDVLHEGNGEDGSAYACTSFPAVSLDNPKLHLSCPASPNESFNLDLPNRVPPLIAPGETTFQKHFDAKGHLSEVVTGAKNAEDDYADNRDSEASSSSKTKFHRKRDIDVQVHREKLTQIYGNILIVDRVSTAKKVVGMLTTKYKDLVHACDMEVAGIDVKQETPVEHGKIICFSIYSGPKADFGKGKSCIWVDILDGERNVLMEFAPFFEDISIKKVWHNYSFDYHALENHGIKVSGFYADTMHLARLWDTSRRNDGGYSLEALTGDSRVMSGQSSDMYGQLYDKTKDQLTSGKIPALTGDSRVMSGQSCDVSGQSCDKTKNQLTFGKISMKHVFGRYNTRKDGSEGKLVTIPPVETLQREVREPWICYSALDSISTLKLYEILKDKLCTTDWFVNGEKKGSMYDFYESYWRPFGDLLVKMESEGMLVDRAYLAEIELVATAEQQVAAERFRKWASKYCVDARNMNVGSDTQIRQLFFGGVQNRKNPNEFLPTSKKFKVPNTEKIVEVGKKSPSKNLNITLTNICRWLMVTDTYTDTGWPSVGIDALKSFAGNVSANEFFVTGDGVHLESDDHRGIYADGSTIRNEKIEASAYGKAYAAFGEGQEGIEACHAIATLCEVCSIDSLLSNFILPLQGNRISSKCGRVHCSLNINTETGRLSARRPNLQNQPALEKDRYKIRQAFTAAPGNSLIVADYGQLELRLLAHLAGCKSMLDAFKAGGDFHSRTAMNMYDYILEAVLQKRVLIEWHPQPGEEKPPIPLLKDVFAAERRKAKMLNFSIAYGKTPIGLSRDWKVSLNAAKETVDLWYKERQEVLTWQEERKKEALGKERCVYTLLGRARNFPLVQRGSSAQKGHIERAAINTPVQGSAADVAMCAMLQIAKNSRLNELKWKLLLQVHDEVILEGPTESAEEAKAIVVECMTGPFDGQNMLKVDLVVDAKIAQNWYAAK